MTDTLETPEVLPAFEGRSVRRSAVKITRAGDGLSEALKLEPEALHHGEEVFFVLRGAVSQVNHRPVDAESDDLVRVHTIDTTQIAKVDARDVEKLLAAAAERVRKAKEVAGQEALELDGEEP